MTASTLALPSANARQQPTWTDAEHVAQVRTELAALPALVPPDEIDRLHASLAAVAGGHATVVQAGDCAEDPAESTMRHVVGKLGLLALLAGEMAISTRQPVIRVGRIAGQYAKPRSNPTEVVDGVELPVFRGPLVNGPGPNLRERRPDPSRLLTGYWAASRVLNFLRSRVGTHGAHGAPVWTSHEALVLDYEVPQLRTGQDVRLYLTSTHWPWIGERTRNTDGPHVALMARIANPVACKIGPTVTRDEALELADRLDPDRVPGRLTLISRMGAARCLDVLPGLVEALVADGHPAIWMCDPMHANTVTSAGGVKTRYLDAIVAEVAAFRLALADAGRPAGGLHLETTPEPVVECLPDDTHCHELMRFYTTLCDPRLNPSQAFEVVAAW